MKKQHKIYNLKKNKIKDLKGQCQRKPRESQMDKCSERKKDEKDYMVKSEIVTKKTDIVKEIP